MTPVICDMLDYTECDTYIEPFGGGARVLLNKPRHPVEIYNDASAGLCAFMRCMSKPELAQEVISQLYDTEYSPEKFYAAVQTRNKNEHDMFAKLKRPFRQLKRYLSELDRKYSTPQITGYIMQVRRNINTYREKIDFAPLTALIQCGSLSEDEKTILEYFAEDIKELLNCISPVYESIVENEFETVFENVVNAYIERLTGKLKSLEGSTDSKDTERMARLQKDIQLIRAGTPPKVIKKKIDDECERRIYDMACERVTNTHDAVSFIEDNENVDDVSLAVATWIVYTMSRDGMGLAFSPQKFKSQEQYHTRISRLYEVAERMEGVEVSQVGALLYLNECDWLTDEKVCAYLDPSYLDPVDEQKNLGGTYKLSSDYDDHELLLKKITAESVKAKIVISNYDVPLYNKYLKAPTWKKYEFDTTTSVGGVVGNYRKEVIWKNFD